MFQLILLLNKYSKGKLRLYNDMYGIETEYE